MIIGVDIRPLLESQPTGVGNYAFLLLKHLLELDQQNSYKLFSNSLKNHSRELMGFLKLHQNVKLYSFRYPSKFFNATLSFFKKPYLDKIIGGADVFWFPNLNFWSVSQNCKTIITVHDLSFKRIPWAYSKKMRWWHHLVKPHKKLSQADKIITVSENTKNDLMEIYGLAENKIEVVYPGVESRITNLESRGLEFKLPEKFILYLGTLEPRKNVEGVIQAFEKINQKNLHLVIAGGKGWLYRNIYQLANQSKAKERVIFLNYIDPDDRWQLYQKAQALVWPSFYEGFGFPPLEAMLQGCPVITSANSSLPEVVGDAALLVDPYNIQETAAAINELLIDDKLRQNLISKGYEQVKRYSWENSAQKMLKMITSLI